LSFHFRLEEKLHQLGIWRELEPRDHEETSFRRGFDTCSTVAFSQGMPRDSVVLGERTVDFHGDHDVIAVGNYEGRFKDIGFGLRKNNCNYSGLCSKKYRTSV
jgi:hypothetical protein